ncbi:multidrug efflux transporter transcriptional repressor AcrR [Pantoea anthophila]|uniref:multidrug efflux transporter transcriptional repressor AcrR n=1 Tax=Pantoea anthophila TaxID=470931 RepID=UPI002DB967AF|nr:multidrug efflux transporter transcriptional repressor AcrR [Pantoea anthophila]MEB5707293.1 multidrug efflux transporter transcriptional repressor AcrR [Pantoea anthophila]MEB6518164.1 multidrug efflux transporter transcriptional repressor AcrR [Pantoea anthophila]
MARKTKAQALETRHQILDAALVLFSQQGVSATSLADIATAASVTRGAIYWHFKNKADLLHEIWLRCDAGLDDVELEYQTKYPGDPLSVLRAMLVYIFEATAKDPQRRALMEIIFHKCEFVGEMSAMKSMQQSLLLECYDKIEDVLRQCIEAEQLPGTLSTRQAAIILRGYVNGMMESWLFAPESIDLAADAPTLVNAFIDMLCLSPTLTTRH